MIMSEPDLIPTINTAAQNPKIFRQDGTEAVAQPIGDQIEADVYTKANANASGLPFRRVQLSPGNNADVHVRGSGI